MLGNGKKILIAIIFLIFAVVFFSPKIVSNTFGIIDAIVFVVITLVFLIFLFLIFKLLDGIF